MCLLRCIQGPAFRDPSSFFSASILRTTRPRAVLCQLLTYPVPTCPFDVRVDVSRVSTMPSTSPTQRQIRTFDVARHTHTKHLHTAPADDAGPPRALERKVRSSCPSTRPRGRTKYVYVPSAHTHTVDFLDCTAIPAALARLSEPG